MLTITIYNVLPIQKNNTNIIKRKRKMAGPASMIHKLTSQGKLNSDRIQLCL